MQITVCVAVTPTSETKVAIAADGCSIDTAQVKYEINPYDLFGLEEALRIAEAHEGAEVEVISVGDGMQKDELRKCLARGANRARILKADLAGSDSAAVAAALSTYIAGTETKIAFFGKQAIDGDNAQVPTIVAAELGWPVVTKISKLELDGDKFVARREIEGGVEVVEGSLPAVFSAEKGLNEPRLPSLKGIMQAKKKPLDEEEVELAANRVNLISLALPAPRPEGRIIGEGAAAVTELVDLLRNEAKVI